MNKQNAKNEIGIFHFDERNLDAYWFTCSRLHTDILAYNTSWLLSEIWQNMGSPATRNPGFATGNTALSWKPYRKISNWMDTIPYSNIQFFFKKKENNRDVYREWNT